MKKLLSVILSIIMIMAMAVPAVSVLAADEYPVVYIEGFGHSLYTDTAKPSSENKIYPMETDVGAVISEALMPCLQQLASGAVTGNYDKYCDELYNAFAPLYDKVRLDKNGEASDGSGCGVDMTTKSIPKKTSGYGIHEYKFEYDWRLSPVVIAAQLKDFIDRVKAVTGESKVHLVGRCLGGNVVAAYLTKYEDHAAASIESVLFYVSAAMGIDLVGALFSGNIVIDENNVDTFVNYYLGAEGIIEDPMMNSLVTSSVSFFNQIKVLGLGVDALQNIVDNVKDNLVPRAVLASYGSFPSFWAMVDVDSYEEARDFVFKGIEDEYKGMIEKTDDYYYNVQLKLYDTIERLETKGVKTSVISKYNLPTIPLYDNANENSDVFVGVYETSMGATSAPIGEVLSDEYIDGLEDAKYVSPDRKVDASTALVPERTWFIKNLSHGSFPDSVDVLIKAIVDSNGELTVFGNEAFPQYIEYNAETEEISPVTGLDEDATEKSDNEVRFSAFIRFFTAIINFFTKLFNGELDLGGLSGKE